MTEPRVRQIDVHELKKRRDSESNLCLIDVREVDEWKALHIPGAIHIPKDEIPACIQSQVSEQDKPIYLHCKGGVRSLYAGAYLLSLGYQEVYSIDGGIIAWAEAGYPVTKEA